MLFSIDHGNSAVKTPNFTFTSGLADYPVRPPVETDVLEYAGKFWTLSGQRISYMRDKTQNDRYFILTLFAIAKELQRMGSFSVCSPQPWKRIWLWGCLQSTMRYAGNSPVIFSVAPYSSHSTTHRSALSSGM